MRSDSHSALTRGFLRSLWMIQRGGLSDTQKRNSRRGAWERLEGVHETMAELADAVGKTRNGGISDSQKRNNRSGFLERLEKIHDTVAGMGVSPLIVQKWLKNATTYAEYVEQTCRIYGIEDLHFGICRIAKKWRTFRITTRLEV